MAQDFCMTLKKLRFSQKNEKVNAPAIFLKIFGPAGGSARGKVLRSRNEYDSESFSALKSNMGAGTISFLSVTDYLYFSHPSIVKISRLPRQNSTRMIPDLKKCYSFSLV